MVSTNNELSTFVHVLKGGLRVLYIEGFPPRVEQRFLVRSLTVAPDVHIDRVVYRPIVDSTARLANLKSGSLDLIERALATDLKEIKSDPEFRKIPVVVLTTSKADTDIGRIYELGANSFISKPVSFDSLVEVMRSLSHYWFEIVELPTKQP